MKKILLLSILPFLLLLTGIYLQGYPNTEGNSPLKIMASVYPLMEFAQAVCGERGEVSLLLPPGADIHSWQPRPSDLVKLSSSHLFIYVGANLEPWLGDILKSVAKPSLRVMEASKGLELIRRKNHHHGAVDPHVWLDFENDQIIVDRITELVSEMDPNGKEKFLNNAGAYKKKLRELDKNYRKTLEHCRHRILVLGGHAAFGYLARRYNLQQISLYGLSPDSKPTPKQLIQVVEFVKQRHIKAVFFERHLSDELARVMAEETGTRTLSLNPGAILSKDQLDSGVTFLAIMEKNLASLKDGLICR